jgi:tRNA-2-methylthio-N6-dimethylallyladenosine synthase
MTPRLASVFRDVPKICPHLHMPAQAGSDAVLARMNRRYTAADYLECVARVREACPEVAIVSDFIVGFPGETSADFEATLDLVQRLRPAGGFVFKYSPRPGTLAARRFPDDVPTGEKRRRNRELLARIESITAEENRKFIGRRVKVLVEGLAPRPQLNAGRPSSAAAVPHSALGSTELVAGRSPHWVQLRGRTPCNRIVVVDGPPDLVGREVDAAVVDAGALTLFATLDDLTGPGVFTGG